MEMRSELPGMSRASFGRMITLVCVLAISTATQAAVVDASDTHYRLRHEATSTLAPAAMWRRLLHPERWWHPDHTYSGDAANLSLDARAGGYWLENWSGGSVAHGRVLLVQDERVLRLDAPFGPLQGLGAVATWTITLEPIDEGTRVVFEETATAAPGSAMEAMAKAVDGVKSEAIRRLTGGE